MLDWRTSASLETLKLRAWMLAEVRQFFAEREVLEVETPLLDTSTVTDVHIQSFEIGAETNSLRQALFLQTSPEYAMKRMLSADSGAIYQICKAFRHEERTQQHNPEFTLLEWYQPGYSMQALMDEVEALIQCLLKTKVLPRFSYGQLFQTHLGLDPHSITLDELRSRSAGLLEVVGNNLDATDYLQLLLSQKIEPQLPPHFFVYDYPSAQAALAVVENDSEGNAVAKRFELYCGGMELANGYFELTDAAEQRQRFERDQNRRRALGSPEIPVDEMLLAALDSGLPNCAGVALGLDRLLMVLAGKSDIGEVLSFPSS
ncbi:MAG: elongation factor P lysine(34) lysyltransferase [Gammaproteobacteria bacterium]|nr:elongation factor P lysine(34) lysyltransferase [Gammaproteobacteria bacterium]|tara:strand:+ start:2901 stop:3851 length:951 start_codon:yes stop_codon:yes gene_type:complete